MRRSIASLFQRCRLLVLPLAFLALAGTGVSLAATVPFGPQKIVSTSDSKGLDVIAGDIDGDGDLDLVAWAGTNTPSGVYWYENLDGKGTYSTSHLIDGSSGGLFNPVSIALADMDGDGDLDLLTGWAYLCAWYPNDGHGHFGARTVIRDETFNGSWYGDFQAADIDGDGDLDVAAIAGSPIYGANKIVWFRNNGGGTFNPAIQNFVGSLVNDDNASVVPADMDGDGDIDLVATETGGGAGHVVWYRNTDGAGNFSAKLTLSGAIQYLGDISVADIDGDGDLDVVSTDYSFSADRWHENVFGDGSAWIDHLMGVTDTYSFFVNTADVDMDGDIDVLVGSRVSNQGVWLENNGNGTAWARRVATTGVNWPLAAIAADVDGDGDPDFVTASLNDDKIAWNENRTIHRNAKFDAGVNMDFAVPEVTEPRVADLDGDGDPDVVAALRSSGRLVSFENDGAAPENWPLRNIATGIPAFTESSTVADIDGDGDLDVVISPGGGVIHWYQNNGALPPTFIDRTLSSSLNPGIDIDAGDIDGDGDTDLMALSYSGLAWYENNGATLPGWTERAMPGSFNSARDLLLADLDRDGDLDAVATDNSSPTLRWYENNGASPPAWTQRSILSPADPLSVEAADVDGDGDLDLVIASASDSSVRWIENGGGAPIVWMQHTVATGVVALSAFPADLDGDGDIDILAGISGTNQTWYESNGGSPPLWTPHGFPGFNIRQWNVIDLNGDGDVDLIGAAPNVSRVDAFENLGGQYGFTTTSATTGLAYNGEASPLLTIGLQVNARPGDSVGRLDSVQTLFQRNPGPTVLTTSEANALIDELRVYRDDGDEVFEANQDYLVATVATLSLTAGVQTIALPPSDPNVRVAAPAKFFAVAVMAQNASTQSPNVFNVTHLAVSGSVVLDANAGIGLKGESTTDVIAGPITARPRFVVNSFGDAVDATPGDGFCATAGAVCTLRAAVMESNAFAGSDRIVLGAGTYTLSVGGPGEDLAAQGDLDVTGPLTIAGAGAGSTIISGGGIDRVFDVRSGGNLVLEDLRLQGGFLSGLGNQGGATRTTGSCSLTLRRCDLRNNQADVAGAINNNGGTTIVEDSLIYNNVGSQSAAFGNSSGTATLRNVTISGNTGTNAVVGVYNGTMTVDGCTVSGNAAEGLKNFGAATFQVRNTLVAGNALAIAGGFTSQGYNLIDNVGVATGFTNGVNNDKVGGGANPIIDAKLMVLGDYGGPTLTRQLLSTSPAVDAGSRGTLTADQRGVKRPIDVAGVPNVGDGCDIGAYELESGATLSRVEVPVRWCGLHGSPSIENPSLMGASNVNDLLRRRHEAATDNIYAPQAGIVFRSAANFNITNYPVLEDPDCTQITPGNYTCTRGVRGDVYIDPAVANFDEYEGLIASCRAAWQALDPKIEGVTAVQINHFVDKTGVPLSILGIGGRAKEGDAREQAEAGRVAVVDSFYRQSVPGNPNPPNPSDTIDRLLGHELGHAVSLRHGDGLDNDVNGVIDDDDEKVVGLPRFDGDNIMQYRAGSTLTAGQATQARNHVAATVPDVTIQPFADAAPNGTPIDPKNAVILEFGFNGVLSLANARILDFKNASVLEFEQNKVPDFANARILDFKNASVLEFKNASVLEFGMSYNGETAAGSTSLQATTAAIPWPASLRPKTRYFFYLDLDRDDGTGAYPADKVNPSDAPTHFPGSNNFVSSPTVAQEAGVDLIAEVEIQSTCAGNLCTSTSQLRIFDYNDGTGAYVEVSSTPSPSISTVEAGLYVDNGGAPVDLDTAPTGITVQPVIPNSLLFAAGWGFTTPPGGGAPVPKPVRMEVVTTIGCVGNVLNDGSAASSRNCQCGSCATCPNYPGCVGTVGTPQTLAGTTILTDHSNAELTFQPPILPACTVIPALASQGQAVTVYVTQLPTNLSGTVEVTRTGTVIGTTPTGSISAAGSVSVAATLPSTASGQVTLSAGITGYAPRAQCLVNVTPTLACVDSDGDGICDSVDPDDDNDGIPDGTDSAPLNRFVCRDTDGDSCDDCSSGTNAPLLDGPDFDLDGLCDRGDPDDDNDGVLDGADGQPRNVNACGDVDGDSCDDCVIANTPSPGNDGPDADGDGLCDFGDPDDDNDGAADWLDCAPNNATLKAAAAEVAGVLFGSGGNKNRLTWTAVQTQGGSATVSDVVRGTGAGLPVGSGAETCLATGSSAAQFDDATAPTSGQLLWYLVRARNTCGNSGYGKTSAGVVRTSNACP